MGQFPAVDPIPIPAPMWLMKALSLVTLSLHFTAVMMLVGGLIMVTWFAFGSNSTSRDAAFVIARRLPALTTFVVNLGVPPLLFAQVMYGRAIYSSSVLIGMTWISVIFLVMLAYWLIYRVIGALESQRPAALLAGLTLLVVLVIGNIYSMNMTLMLRPDVWQAMYAHSPSGAQAFHGDPTVMPRWLFVMAGGPLVGGLWAVLLAHLSHLSDGVKTLLRKGGILAGIGAVVQLGCAFWVVTAQPNYVMEGLSKSSIIYPVGGILFVACAVVAGLVGAIQGARQSGPGLAYAGVVAAFLATTGSVIYRDGLRDASLGHFGFNVWDRVENSNWTVIGAFLLLFVVMLGVVVWLLKVVASAEKPRETVTQ